MPIDFKLHERGLGLLINPIQSIHKLGTTHPLKDVHLLTVAWNLSAWFLRLRHT